jgi:MoaA/NifB/PqqE/SkfB family radical SAM enzyme
MPGQRDKPDFRERYYRELNAKTLQVIRSGVARPQKTFHTVMANPRLISRGIRRVMYDRRAASLRKRHEEAGLIVPPFLFLSVTARCNLACPGCFTRDRRETNGPEMTGAEIGSIVTQASRLGVTGIIILGGEPLLRWKELLPVAHAHPDILFPLFTNGVLADEKVVADLARTPNIIPFISIDGSRADTDARRGEGVYDRLLDLCRLFDQKIPLFGLSVTVTADNFHDVLSEQFTRSLLSTGAGAVGFLQWVPTDPATKHLVLSPAQRHTLYEKIIELNKRFPALFIAAPGDVERFGGCLAAGRGFVAINPWGHLEPCMMVPLPVADVKAEPLKDALGSPLLREIRKNHEMLKAHGRCRLRTDLAWVNELVAASKER